MQQEAQTTALGFLAVSAGAFEIEIVNQGALEVWSLYRLPFTASGKEFVWFILIRVSTITFISVHPRTYLFVIKTVNFSAQLTQAESQAAYEVRRQQPSNDKSSTATSTPSGIFSLYPVGLVDEDHTNDKSKPAVDDESSASVDLTSSTSCTLHCILQQLLSHLGTD